MANQPDPNADPNATEETAEETTPDPTELAAAVKKMQRENAGLRGELKKREDTIKAAQDEKLSDLEKLTVRNKELESENGRLTATIASGAVERATVAAASRLGFEDPEDAIRLLNTAEVTLENGKYTNLDDLLKEILDRKPYLGRGQQPTGGGTSNPGPRTAPAGKLNMNDVLRTKIAGR